MTTDKGETMSELAWEYRGDGLYIYWKNPFNDGAKEDVVMFMWPCHSPEDTTKVEQIYESMAKCFIDAWNGQSAPCPTCPKCGWYVCGH